MELKTAMPCSQVPPPIPTRNYRNPVRSLPTYSSQIHFIIILPSTARSFTCIPAFRYYNLSHAYYRPGSPNTSLFEHINSHYLAKVINYKFLNQKYVSHVRLLPAPWKQKLILFSNRFSDSANLCYSLSVRYQISRPHKSTGNITLYHD